MSKLWNWLDDDPELTSGDLERVMEVLHELAVLDLSVMSSMRSGARTGRGQGVDWWHLADHYQVLRESLYRIVQHPNCAPDLLVRLATLSITAVRLAQRLSFGPLETPDSDPNARDLPLLGRTLTQADAVELDERVGAVAVRRLRAPDALGRLARIPGYLVSAGTPVVHLTQETGPTSYRTARMQDAPRTRLELALHPALPAEGASALANDPDERAAVLALVHPKAPPGHVARARDLGAREIARAAGAPDLVLSGLVVLWTTAHPSLLGPWAQRAADQGPPDEFLLAALATHEQSWNDPASRKALQATAHLAAVASALWSNAFWPTAALASAQATLTNELMHDEPAPSSRPGDWHVTQRHVAAGKRPWHPRSEFEVRAMPNSDDVGDLIRLRDVGAWALLRRCYDSGRGRDLRLTAPWARLTHGDLLTSLSHGSPTQWRADRQPGPAPSDLLGAALAARPKRLFAYSTEWNAGDAYRLSETFLHPDWLLSSHRHLYLQSLSNGHLCRRLLDGPLLWRHDTYPGVGDPEIRYTASGTDRPYEMPVNGGSWEAVIRYLRITALLPHHGDQVVLGLMSLCDLGLTPDTVASAWAEGVRSIEGFEQIAAGVPVDWVQTYEQAQQRA